MPARTSCSAAESAVVAELDLGAVARWITAWARLSWHSGRPMFCTA